MYAQVEEVERGDIPAGVMPYRSPIADGGDHAGLGFTIPILGINTDDIVSAVNLASSLGGKSSQDWMKGVWSKVPASDIRVQGGSGHWTDPITGESMGDAGTDVRKGAVVASAIGAFPDQSNHWMDLVTGQGLSPDDTAKRWIASFGSVSYDTAYRQHPERFLTFQPSTASNDPPILGRQYGLTRNAAAALQPAVVSYPPAGTAPQQTYLPPPIPRGLPSNAGPIGPLHQAPPARPAFTISTPMLVGGAVLLGGAAWLLLRPKKRGRA